MARKITKAMKVQLRKDNQKRSYQLEEIPKSKWPSNPTNLIKVFCSEKYLVQVYQIGESKRLSVAKTSMNGDRWKDNISWDDLQKIKNEIGFEDYWFVEFYPPSSKVVNVANMRHLWLVDQPVGIGWNGR